MNNLWETSDNVFKLFAQAKQFLPTFKEKDCFDGLQKKMYLYIYIYICTYLCFP